MCLKYWVKPSLANRIENLTGRSCSLSTRSRIEGINSPLLPDVEVGARRVLLVGTGTAGILPENLFLAPMGVLFVPDNLMLDAGGGGFVSISRTDSCGGKQGFFYMFSTLNL